jgi:uncharacterized radical SAM protein YgiQ
MDNYSPRLHLSEKWLPITADEMKKRGWDAADVVLVSGDAYVDHPSFGISILGRILETMDLRVAINPQPNWQDDLRDFKKFGKPNLFFGISSGSMDSMVNHYTALKRLRSNDAYTPGGKAGFRPDYATTVYSQIVKKVYPDSIVVLGGIEASMRRLCHYDYWSNRVFPSILIDSKADLLVYGMGEQAIKEIANTLRQGGSVEKLHRIPQIAYFSKTADHHFPDSKTILMPSYEECVSSKKHYAEAFRLFEIESNKTNPAVLVQPHGDGFIIVNPPFPVLSTPAIDEIYALPYARGPHPKYLKRGAIPAWEMIRNSINIHRGCFGGCSFCAIAAHQGKQVVSRSKSSILEEIDTVVHAPDFNGHITDLGGPSANMYLMKGEDPALCNACARPSCIFPAVCKNLNTDHHPLIDLYREVRERKQIKHVTIGSGIRYDMLLSGNAETAKRNGFMEYIETLIRHHVSGRLKVAPEHTSDDVLKLMRKPSFRLFKSFKKIFDDTNLRFGLKQQLIPYFISSHPASTVEAMANLAGETSALGYRLEQIQDFTPTPMTLSTTIFYCGFDPYTLKPVYTAKEKSEKQLQQTFFFWYKPENRAIIQQQLLKRNRKDLVEKIFFRNYSNRK